METSCLKMNHASGCCFMLTAYVGVFLQNPGSHGRVTGGLPWGKLSAVNHRQRRALGPTCLSLGRTKRGLFPPGLCSGDSAVFSTPSPDSPFLQEGVAEPPLSSRKPQFPFPFIGSSQPQGSAPSSTTCLRAPAALRGEGKFKPSPPGRKRSYF